MMNAESNFRAKAPVIMAQLIRDFPITPIDAAAILGNLGHESAGLATLQEIKPTVAGSRGGYGWAQWTGPRRRAYEAWCAKHGKNPASDEANYAYLFLELKGIEGTEGAAIGKTVKAKDLDAKVEAFEKAFLRAGVKHYVSRKRWAKIALEAWRSQTSGTPIPNPTPTPTPANPVPIDLPDEHEPAPAAKGKSPIGFIVGAVVVIAIIAGIVLLTPIF